MPAYTHLQRAQPVSVPTGSSGTSGPSSATARGLAAGGSVGARRAAARVGRGRGVRLSDLARACCRSDSASPRCPRTASTA